MFVKTKEEICDLNNINPAWKEIALENAISQSENIEDLFDEVVFENKGYVIVGSRRSLKKSVFEEMETQDFKIYGAIWVDTNTKPTLKSVARYENGEWKLI